MGFCLHRPPSLLASPTSTDTPPEEGGEDFGIIGRDGGLSTPSCCMWGSVFPVESGCSRAGTVCTLLSCSAALPLLWQRARFRTCPRFGVADFFSPKAGIYEAQSSPTALFLGFQSLHFPTSQSLPVCFLLHVWGKVCPLHLHESGGLAAIPFHQDLRFCGPGQSRQAWR